MTKSIRFGVVMCSLFAISTASAAIRNWEGDTSATWATAGNWDTAPANSLTNDIANFNLATYGGNPVFAPTVGTATSINGLTIGSGNGTMTLTHTAALSIGNSGITIDSGAGAFTISGSTTLGASQSWLNNNTNLFTFGAVTTGGNTLTIGGSGTNTASGIISGTNGALKKEGAGLLTLNAANTYTGATTVNGGELRWGVNNAIAGGALNINDGGTVNLQNFTDTVGTITLAKGGAITGTTGILSTGLIDSNDGGTFSGFSAGAGLRLSGGITYNSTGPGSTTLQIDRIFVPDQYFTVFDIANGAAAIDFEITGTLSGGGNNISRTIRKTGAGVMQFSGSEANTTSINQMPLNIWDGTVIFNKSAEVNAIPNSTITIGDGIGSAGSAILQYRTSNNQIQSSSITINSDGLFDLNGKSETAGAVALNSTGQLDFNGGTLSVGAVTITATGAGVNSTSIKNTAGTGDLTVSSLAITPDSGYTTTLSLGASGTLTLGGNVTFTAAGTGQAQITGSTLSMDASDRTVTVGLGAGADYDLLIDAQISASGTRKLTKAGAGRLALSNNNSYTGGTTVSAGTLLLRGAFNMPVTGTLTVSSGGTFSLADGTARATTGATTGSGLNLAAGSSLAFDWNGSSLDSFTTVGTATTVAGAVGIHINNINPTGSGGTLITAASGLGTASYFLANNANYTATISKTPTTVSIGAQSAATALTDAYWLGGKVTGALGAMALSSDSTSNWASDAAGTSAAGVVPGGSAVNVIFSATGASQQASVTTGADMNLGSITFNDSAAVTIGGGSTLTLNSTSGTAATTSGALATVTAGSAISVTQYSSDTSNANTINANLLLGANQTWNIASGKTLFVTGQVAGDFGLTKADAGTLILTGANSYRGTTTISAGTLQIGNGSTTGSLSPLSAIVNNASLVFNRSDTVTQGSHFTAAAISGSGSLTKSGTGTLTLTASNSFGGGVFINGGTLNISSGNYLGDLVTFTGTGTLELPTMTLSQGFVINAGVTGTLRAGYATVTVNNALAGSGTLVASGGGTGSGGVFIFTSTNNPFSGNIEINSYSGGSYGASLTMNSLNDTPGSRIKMSNTTSFTYGDGAVAPLVFNNRQIESTGWEYGSSLNNNATNTSSTVTVNTDLIVSGGGTDKYANRPFTLGGSNTNNNTFAGAITDGAGYVVRVTKDGAGTWVLSGNNTFSGTTTVKDGTLVLAGSKCLSDTNLLSIANGKKVKLEAGVKEKVGILKLNNVQQVDGVWGATGNTKAQYTSSYLLGDGLLYVNTALPAAGTLISFK